MKQFWCSLFALLLLGVVATGCPTKSTDPDAGQGDGQQQDGSGECRVEDCTPPENATSVCNQGVCDFECNDGYFRSGEACEECTTDGHCGTDCLPCDTGLTCCDGVCVDLLTDPEHCGSCDNPCAAADYTCCDGKHCCWPQKPKCCPGDFCCEEDGICCPQACCPISLPTCCGSGCCVEDAICCHDKFCCEAQYPICCEENCCPETAPICCPGSLCCESGNHCCDTGCCPD